MTTPEPYDSDDDDLSEIDTTPEQFDAMMAEAEPAVGSAATMVADFAKLLANQGDATAPLPKAV